MMTVQQQDGGWEKLEELRRTGERNPECVVRIATRLLGGQKALLDADRSTPATDLRWWAAAEQLYIAALDTARWDLARALLAKMQRRFPPRTSAKTRRLGAMLLEATGDTAAAAEIYRQLVAADPTDLPAMKRQIAMLRGSGDIAAAIAQLNVLLRVFSADTEAWLELAELYVLALRPRLAAFCYEEALLAQPQNYVLWSRAAEAQYTCGELVIARKYFARAAELSECQDARALLGLCMACQAIQCSISSGKRAAGTSSSPSSSDATINRDLHAWAAQKLAPLLPIAVQMLARQRTLFF